MRKKSSSGGRARLSHPPPKPSVFALHLISQSIKPVNKDESIQDMELETSSDRVDIGRGHVLVSNTSGEMAFPHKKTRGLDTCGEKECSEINWTEKEICIKCNKSGKVLVCCDGGCPIAVHEKCMGCLARIDDLGNFNCPYCSYKRAIAELRQAREKAMLAKKALSIFMDKELIDGNQQKQKSVTAERKEFTLSAVAGSDNEIMPESNPSHDQSIHTEDDHQEEAFAPECTTSNLPCKEADEQLGNKQNDVTLNRSSDDARINDWDGRRMVVEHQTESEPVVAFGSDSVCCREEGTPIQCETIAVSKRLQVEHKKQVEDNKYESVVEDEEDAEHLSASPVEEETTLDGGLHVSTDEKLDDAKVSKENEGRGAVEEQMQEQAHQTTVRFTCEEPAPQVHSKANRGVEASESICKETQTLAMQAKHTKQKDNTRVQPLNAGSLRRSSRKSSSEQRTSTGQNEKIITSSNSRQLEEPSKRPTNAPIPNVRRKKLPWRDEEEEMLKEGVQKYSTTVNKNLPWRRILEFGHHVFDGTRTPVDLKDKWRNILAKECSKE